MNRTNGSTLNKGIPVFRLDGGEMHHIAKHILGLGFGDLSPFKGQPEGGERISTEAQALLDDPDFQTMMRILAAPDFRLAFRAGGPAGTLRAFSVFGRRGYHPSLAVLESGGEAVNCLLFGDEEEFGVYIASNYAVPSVFQPVNLIKTEVPAEFIIFVFNLADCYRRAYLNNLLQYSSELIEGMYEDEFVAVLERELKSLDTRWLVPSLFQLVPSLRERHWEFSKNEVDIAVSMDFISRARSPEDKRPVFLLGNSGKYWGLEFSLYWRKSLGVEVWANTGSDNKVVRGRSYYMAFTDEANHFIEMTPQDSRLEVVHKALTAEQTAQEIAGIIVSCSGDLVTV